MKKLITISLLVITLLVGGITADAKKKKSSGRSKSSSSVVFPQYADGYADISGHSYACTYQGETTTIKFGRDGIARFTGTDRGKKHSFNLWWSYQGMGVVSVFGDDGSQSIDFDIEDNGKALNAYMDGIPLTFKLK